MMLKNLLLASIIIFASCSSEKKKNEIILPYSLTLEIADTLNLSISNQTTYSPYTLQYFQQNENEYLLCANNYLNTIDVYDIGKKALVHSLPVNSETTQYIENFYGFTLANDSSLYVYKRMSSSPIVKLKLDDFKVTARESFQAYNPVYGSTFLNHASMTASPTIAHGSTLSFTLFPLGEETSQRLRKSDPAYLEFIYDTENDTSFYSNLHYPEVYFMKDWKGYFQLYCKTINWNGELVYSWEASDSIHLMQDGKQKAYYAASSYFDESPRVTNDLTNEGLNKSIRESNSYSMILADKYRKVYYRFGHEGIPYYNDRGVKNTPYDKAVVITVLDENFELIAEKMLPAKSFLYKDAFVGKDGLYISTKNAKNENIQENNMEFAILQLVKQQ